MKPELKERLVKVNRVLTLADRLGRFARVGKHKESEFLVEELLDFLKDEGYNGRHKCVRLVRNLSKAMKADGYVFEKA